MKAAVASRRMAMPCYDVFLSHASADKPAVEYLAHKLREEELKPFLDKWHLIPGEPWQEALEEALDQSRTCAVFIGKELGPWQNKEMRSALETQVQNRSFRAIPVLLPGGRKPGEEKLPRFLRALTWVDFRAGLDNEDAFRRLLAGIRGEAPGPGSGGGGETSAPPYRCMAPAREQFVARREYEKAVQALLAGGGKERVATVGLTTALQGAGGFGKTALATELCYDPRVREQYPDGVLWTTLGEEIDATGRLARVRDLIRWWTEKDPPAFETVSAASAHLRQEVEGKRVLLVVDDVWRPEDVTPFQGFGARAAFLVTTRDSRTLPADSVSIHVDAMEVPEAVRLLGAGLPDGTGVDLQVLARRLGEWPLLLKIVNRQLRELIQNDGLSPELALKEVEEALDAEGLTAFDREDLESRNLAVAQTVGASLRWLSGEEVERFEQLAIFPEDKDIPLRVPKKLWGLGPYAAKKFGSRLHDLSLLLRFDRLADTIRLHDVIRAYLLKKGESHLTEWNRRLLEAFRPANGRWSELPREENYLWNHLFHHLIGAGQSDVCRNLLLDFHYLGSKLDATDINALLADYSFFAEKDGELRLVRDALRLSAHVLVRNPAELPGQLRGRLLDRQEAGIRGLSQASEGVGTRWLRPRKPSLTSPGGPLIRTIEHPGLPDTLAVLSDGRVISGSEDGALRVWDVESGQILKILKGHSAGVTTMAVLDSRRVVSGSYDRTLRVWDVESGQVLVAVAVLDSRRVVFGSNDLALRVWDVENRKALQVLKGHSYAVNALAVCGSSCVVSGSSDGTLRVWDVESGQVLQILELSSDVLALAMLDSRRIVSGSYDGALRVWDMEGGQAPQPREGHSDSVVTVTVLDNRRVVSISRDGTLRVWYVESGYSSEILGGHLCKILAVAVLDSHRVVVGYVDGTLRVWDLESRQALQVFEGHPHDVRAMAVLDSHRVVVGHDDGTSRIWDVESGQAPLDFDGPFYGISSVVALDSYRMVFGYDNGALLVWDVESGQVLLDLDSRLYSSISSVAVLDSRWVVSGSDAVRVCDLESREILQTLEGHSDWVRAVAVLGSHRVVSGSDDRTLRVWDVESGKAECQFTLDAPVTAVAVTPDCRIIVAGDASGRVHFFDFVES